MNNKNRNSKTKKNALDQSSDEVEQLLQAAQDEMLLKLSVDSHMSRVSPNHIDPDLHRRFQALKSKPSSTPPPQLPSQHNHAPAPAPVPVDDDLKGVLGDDLSTRFAALKSSLAASSSENTEVPVGCGSSEDEDDDEESEIEKVIRWAKDAARLDPSLPSDEEIDSDDFGSDSDEEDEAQQKKNHIK